MQKIKFRFFCNKRNQFLSDDEFLIHPSKGVFYVDEYDVCNEPANGHLLQFTGILDKNGKEIYEGDIIFNDMSEDKSTVKWDEILTSYIIVYKDSSWLYLHEICDDLNCYEIIGNIYQNPELL